MRQHFINTGPIEYRDNWGPEFAKEYLKSIRFKKERQVIKSAVKAQRAAEERGRKQKQENDNIVDNIKSQMSLKEFIVQYGNKPVPSLFIDKWVPKIGDRVKVIGSFKDCGGRVASHDCHLRKMIGRVGEITSLNLIYENHNIGVKFGYGDDISVGHYSGLEIKPIFSSSQKEKGSIASRLKNFDLNVFLKEEDYSGNIIFNSGKRKIDLS
ncbi:hypothetical protein HYS94_02095 [Candidatus Daviesbacteria bacterium]|nr:hypothetical protein [Candidatus Daviesbacteria bacterium]